MRKQQGFTLIELIVVIVILGILAATALPKFFDLKADAAQAAVKGVAGALSSGSAINYATRLIHPSSGVAIAACNSANVQNLVDGVTWGGGATGYALSTATSVASGASAQCTLTGPGDEGSRTATYTVIGA